MPIPGTRYQLEQLTLHHSGKPPTATRAIVLTAALAHNQALALLKRVVLVVVVGAMVSLQRPATPPPSHGAHQPDKLRLEKIRLSSPHWASPVTHILLLWHSAP